MQRATEHILHRRGIGRWKHEHVAQLCIQDEFRSIRLRVRRVKSEENVADLGTKAPSESIVAQHSTTIGDVNMNEENVEDVQHVAMFWDFQRQRQQQHVTKAKEKRKKIEQVFHLTLSLSWVCAPNSTLTPTPTADGTTGTKHPACSRGINKQRK